MEGGRQRAIETKMKGCVNIENKMTDIYLPRKCDYTDKIITSKDHSSIQLSICDVHVELPRSTPTAPSTSASPTSSPSAVSSDPPVRATLLSRESLTRKNCFDRLDIFHSEHHHSTSIPLYLPQKHHSVRTSPSQL